MDDADRKLVLLIEEEPRMPLKELAKKLGISRQAANNRIQTLTKLGAFKGIKAHVSLQYLDAVVVGVWGRSNTESVNSTLDRLAESEFTARVAVAGGNEFYIQGCLRDLSELDGYVEFVKRVAAIPEPTAGIYSFHDGINPSWMDGPNLRRDYRDLSSLDFRIILSLRSDARKPVAEIASEVGASIKTVRRRIDRMRSEGSLEYGSVWVVPPGEDLQTMLYVRLKSGSDIVRVARRLLSMDAVHLSYLRSFSNLPDFLIGLVSSDKMSEILRILKTIDEDEDVLSVVPNLIYLERCYENCWDDKLIRSLARSSEKDGKLRLTSGLEAR